ncbi:archaemetzincin family Zn-dependent metalloprotease [Palaeococcus ferrophilus]|uniref:archaemetzincin family Zn-dependent metalloprotease n=1 Tax=Palaeococcus ferrophilus TaxID=83868 RepID=UPI00064F7A9F|nr:archaemetzincin family Zn-dependent metalloprotease [Palaeococcus ferrophilus]
MSRGRSSLTLVPIITQLDNYIIEELFKRLARRLEGLGIRTVVGEALSPALFRGAYNPIHGQYLAGDIIKALPGNFTLGITDVDIYEEGFNFLFGLAVPRLGRAVVSLHRLDPRFYGEKFDESLFMERALKEALHEFGHLMRLPHCPDWNCLMHFSNSIIEVDMKGDRFCQRCLKRLKYMAGQMVDGEENDRSRG